MAGESISKSRQEAELPPSQWDSLIAAGPSDPSFFEGERNVNDATGKERTFSEMDVYPRMKGETPEEYGERLKAMHEKTEEYLKQQEFVEGVLDEKDMRTDAYEASKFGKKEHEVEDKYDRINDKLDELVKKGVITEERARALGQLQLEKANEEIQGIRQDYEDSRAVGTPEEHRAYRDWLEKHDAENRENLERREEEAGDTSESGDGGAAGKATGETGGKPEGDKPEDGEGDKGDKPETGDGGKPEKDDEADEEGEDAEAKRLAEGRAKQLELERAKRAKIEAMSQEEKNRRANELFEEHKKNEEILEKAEELLKEYDELEAEKEEIDDELEADMHRPLVAVNADFSVDKKDLAHDIAERQLNEETSRAGLLKRLWKGTLFKKFYELKYTDELMSGDRTVEVDGKELSVDELIARRKESAISRFVMSVVDDSDAYIHDKAGERMQEADAETTARIREAIEKFATAKIPEGHSLDELKRMFENDMKRLKAESRDKGDSTDELIFDNYLDVAVQARMRVEHGIAMEEVMEGFKVFDAEVRDGIRTEAHRDNIDKIINKLESSNAAGLVPAEVFAVVFGVTSALTQTGARAIGGAGAGIGVSTLISGLRERNRVTEDRARMLRDVANGMSYEGQSAESPKSASARYEKRIGGTLYDTESAASLTKNIESAMSTEGEARSEATLRAIAEARVRIDFSDAEAKDLIAYSSEDARGKERLALDIATIRAERSLSDEDKKKLEVMKAEIQKEITASVDEKDKKFKHERAVMAVKKAGKTLLIGAGAFLVSQEVMAAMDPGKIGILEKYGILNRANADDAKETLLASGFGLNRGGAYTTDPVTYRADQQAKIERIRADGYTEIQVSNPTTTTTTTLQEITPSASTHQIRAVYDGWANNGTSYSDGNELGLHMSNGTLFTRMGGASTVNGQSLDVDALTTAGKVKGFLTVGGAKFEIAPTMTENGLSWGENGVFTTTTGETIRALGENGQKLYQYFEVAVDNGVDAEGLTHIIPLATDVGSNSFSGTISQVVETPITEPAVLQFVKTVGARGISMQGVAFAPETPRTGLGGPIEAPKPATGEGSTGAGGGPAEAPTRKPEEKPTEETEEEPAEKPTDKPADKPAETTSEADRVEYTSPAEERAAHPDDFLDEEDLAYWNEVEPQAEGVPPEVLRWMREPDAVEDVRSDEEISERQKQYVDWWDKQGESTKQAIGRFVRLIRQSNKDRIANHKKLSEFGKSFMNWLMLNHSSYVS